ncbi:hypothetical protein CP01DC11_1464, partial [Chlamydia psittaci 01DC11]
MDHRSTTLLTSHWSSPCIWYLLFLVCTQHHRNMLTPTTSRP